MNVEDQGDYMPPICPDCREHDDGSRTCDPSLALCPLRGDNTGTAHVLPVGDLVEHTTDECQCGPTSEPVKREDGSVGWVVIHHSLDGREQIPASAARRGTAETGDDDE